VAPEGFFDRIIAQAAATAQSWRERIAADRTQFLKIVIERVVIQPARVEIRLRVPALVKEILRGSQPGVDFPPFASVECRFATFSRAVLYVSSSATRTSRPTPGNPQSHRSRTLLVRADHHWQSNEYRGIGRYGWSVAPLYPHADEAGSTQPAVD
jgi:hypothetical protein